MSVYKLDRQITEYCRENRIMGSLRVTVKEKIEYEKNIGFADLEHKICFERGSMFTYYSLSKPFCAIGLLKLKDKGLLTLDDHPSKYVPEAEGFDGRLTVRQMLCHTSGLPDFAQTREFAEAYGLEDDPDLRRHLKIISRYPHLFAPGTDTMYSNINFVLPALIIENLSGMRYADYMKKEVLEPLGMKMALVDHKGLFVPGRVKGYELAGGRLAETEKTYQWMLGAGDLVGTVDDVYCLNRAIKNALLLKRDTWDEVLTPAAVNNKGLGCTVTDWHGHRRITHNGGSAGFRTLHIQLPEDDFDVIFLSNSGFGNARKDLAEMIYSAFYGDNSEAGEEIDMDTGYIPG